MKYKKFYTVAEIYNLFACLRSMRFDLHDEGTIYLCELGGSTPEKRIKELEDAIKWIFDHIDEESKSKVLKYVWNDLNKSLGIDSIVDGNEKIYIND